MAARDFFERSHLYPNTLLSVIGSHAAKVVWFVKNYLSKEPFLRLSCKDEISVLEVYARNSQREHALEIARD